MRVGLAGSLSTFARLPYVRTLDEVETRLLAAAPGARFVLERLLDEAQVEEVGHHAHPVAEPRVPQIPHAVRLTPERRGEPMEDLSRGMQQKIALARALLDAGAGERRGRRGGRARTRAPARAAAPSRVGA